MLETSEKCMESMQTSFVWATISKQQRYLVFNEMENDETIHILNFKLKLSKHLAYLFAKLLSINQLKID